MKTTTGLALRSKSASSWSARCRRSEPWELALTAAVLALAAGGACSSDTGGGLEGDRNGDGVVDEADGGSTGAGGGIQVGGGGEPAPPGCADGILTEDEACDDGGRVDGDGCAANCLTVDPGFVCPVAGEPCIPFARCGDGVTALPEQCDVGAFVDGDGCTDACKLEQGWACAGSPSVCHETTCGDGNQEGTETCEDDDLLPFDGCDANCQAEPACTDEGCTSSCGDGILLGEECDDGNSIDGDGCSASCEQEEGYECDQAPCERVDGACVHRIPAVYRDFISKNLTGGHSDFDLGGGTQDGVPGVVEGLLDADGKPVLANGSGVGIASTASFAQWYRDAAGKNSTVLGELVLYDNGDSAFVNRFGPAGEQYEATNGTLHDGNPLFFPLQGVPDCVGAERVGCALPETRYQASSLENPSLETGNWVNDTTGPLRNFSFTSEITSWFVYDAGSSATLSFTGDDDVWVFINRRLAEGVDLGGAHYPDSGSVTVSAATAGDFGLTDGGVYEIRIFHAERNKTGSSFKLTLAGFDSSPSICESNCGDGIVGVGEECDDVLNDGGHNECQPGCQLGSYCGDGTKDPGEDCDDGNRVEGDGCGNSCRTLVIR